MEETRGTTLNSEGEKKRRKGEEGRSDRAVESAGGQLAIKTRRVEAEYARDSRRKWWPKKHGEFE